MMDKYIHERKRSFMHYCTGTLSLPKNNVVLPIHSYHPQHIAISHWQHAVLHSPMSADACTNAHRLKKYNINIWVMIMLLLTLPYWDQHLSTSSMPAPAPAAVTQTSTCAGWLTVPAVMLAGCCYLHSRQVCTRGKTVPTLPWWDYPQNEHLAHHSCFGTGCSASPCFHSSSHP